MIANRAVSCNTTVEKTMDIELKRAHGFGARELPVRICSLVQELESKLHLVAKWREDFLAVKFMSEGGFTKGISGDLEFDNSNIYLKIKLPLGLKPMRGMIENTVVDYMNQHIG